MNKNKDRNRSRESRERTRHERKEYRFRCVPSRVHGDHGVNESDVRYKVT